MFRGGYAPRSACQSGRRSAAPAVSRRQSTSVRAPRPVRLLAALDWCLFVWFSARETHKRASALAARQRASVFGGGWQPISIW